VTAGENRGHSELIIVPILPKSWSLSQIMQALPVGRKNIQVSTFKSLRN